jgi:uncharacterized lipoprotein YmbA
MTMRLGCSLLVLLLSACASSPEMRFYTLNVVGPQAPSPAQAEGSPVRIVRVTVPGELDRAQLVRRVDANRLQIAELDRWAAPLDETIRRVLSADLAARLPPAMIVSAADSAASGASRALSVDIQEFSGDASCAVTLRAAWALTPPNGASAQGMEDVRIPPRGACATSTLPAAMSEALAQLSDKIAASIAR